MQPWKERHKLLLGLPTHLADKLRLLAKRESRTLTGQIVHILTQYTENKDEPIESAK